MNKNCIEVAPSASYAIDSIDQLYKVSLTINVRSARQLWRLAAARALALTGLDHEDVEEMIGPMEDPNIGDCLALLLEPAPMAGCGLRALDVEALTPQRAARKRSATGGAARMTSPAEDFRRQNNLPNI